MTLPGEVREVQVRSPALETFFRVTEQVVRAITVEVRAAVRDTFGTRRVDMCGGNADLTNGGSW